MNSSPGKFRRRRTLIQYGVQMTLLLNGLIIAALTALTMHLTELSRAFTEIAVPGFGIVHTAYLWLLPLPLLVICVLWSFVLSNRIVGPIFSLRRHLENVLAGRATGPASCRSTDYFKDLFVVVNRLLAERDQKRGEKGFSLIELMVAVAIVGILAAIAVPNFSEFAKRARHSEAKMNLSTLYQAEKIFSAQYQSYTSTLDAMAYSLSGALWFNIGFDNQFLPPSDAPPGTPGCKETCPTAGCPAISGSWTCTPSASNALDGAGNAIVTASTFKACAHGHFSTTMSDWFTWNIDQRKQLTQLIPAN